MTLLVNLNLCPPSQALDRGLGEGGGVGLLSHFSSESHSGGVCTCEPLVWFQDLPSLYSFLGFSFSHILGKRNGGMAGFAFHSRSLSEEGGRPGFTLAKLAFRAAGGFTH